MERKNFPGLTGIRALAAITIALFHFKDSLYAAFPKTQFLDDWISNGSIFVMFFFILSGFLLFHNYGNKELFTVKSFLRFFVNRIARLLPVSIITQFFAIPILCISIEKYGNWGAPIPNWYSFGYWLKNAFLIMGN